MRQGVQCTDCGTNVHHRCQQLVPKSCGTDHVERRGRIRVTFGVNQLDDNCKRINIYGMCWPQYCDTFPHLNWGRGGCISSLSSGVEGRVHSNVVSPCMHTVHECRNLPPMDANGLADPYVKLSLQPGGSSSLKQKTEKKTKDLNPVFDENFFL